MNENLRRKKLYIGITNLMQQRTMYIRTKFITQRSFIAISFVAVCFS